ncbi:MAG: helix-turn-helix transcriptional regulator [Myxococcota bacterium]|jgi:putative transcriptional regulator
MRNCIRERRLDCGWTQQDLADELGVSRQTVIALEKERYDPSLPLAFEIAATFESTIEQIFGPGASA